MLPRLAFWALLLGICLYAFLRGRTEERLAAGACLAASIGTRFVVSPLSIRYDDVETGLVIIDVAMLALFVGIALRSYRFWPLWIAGLQLTMSMAHVLKAINFELMNVAYGAAAVFWSYPILLIIFVATWRTDRRSAQIQNEGDGSLAPSG